MFDPPDSRVGYASMVPLDPKLYRHVRGYAVLWQIISGYRTIVEINDLSTTVLVVEMGRGEFLALRSLSYDEHLIRLAAGEIGMRIIATGRLFARADPDLPVLVVDRDGVRFALDGGGYAGPDEPDPDDGIGAAEARMRWV